MIPSPEVQSLLTTLRAKVLDQTITQEELREAIVHMRQGRNVSITASRQSRGASPKRPARSAEDLLDELDKL